MEGYTVVEKGPLRGAWRCEHCSGINHHNAACARWDHIVSHVGHWVEQVVSVADRAIDEGLEGTAGSIMISLRAVEQGRGTPVEQAECLRQFATKAGGFVAGALAASDLDNAACHFKRCVLATAAAILFEQMAKEEP